MIRTFADFADDAFRNFTDFWIGGQLTNVNSALIWLWKWHDSIMKYNDWAPGEPYGNKKCVSVSLAKAWWTSNDCNLTKPYVCRIPAHVLVCEDGWTFLEKTKMCYKMFADLSGISFPSASELCQKQNANMVSIHNDEENTLVGKLTSLGKVLDTSTVTLWIGLNYNITWTWTDGTPYDYQAWGQYDPNNIGSQNCVNFYPEGASESGYNSYIMKWDTSYCGDRFQRTVCKKQAKIVPIFQNP
uniref:C-type lectin domain-containing protein n=1 Tax=Panagrolaimus sp. JU765 TaxID=591449 RepID=A0AC34RJV4_9BILA